MANYCQDKDSKARRGVYERRHDTGSFRNARVNAVSANGTTTCSLCDELHTLDNCPEFIAMPTNERFEFVKREKLCFNCLGMRHTAARCNRSPGCNHEGYWRRHHTLLHVKPVDNSVKVNTTSTNRTAAYLGFVPVRIVGPEAQICTCAFLDGGSDTTLLSREIASSLGISGYPTSVRITSFEGTAIRKTRSVTFSLESLDASTQIAVNQAFTVDRLQVKTAT